MIHADTESEPRRRAIRAGGHNDGVGKTVGDFVLTERIRSETEEAFFREVVTSQHEVPQDIFLNRPITTVIGEMPWVEFS